MELSQIACAAAWETIRYLFGLPRAATSSGGVVRPHIPATVLRTVCFLEMLISAHLITNSSPLFMHFSRSGPPSDTQGALFARALAYAGASWDDVVGHVLAGGLLEGIDMVLVVIREQGVRGHAAWYTRSGGFDCASVWNWNDLPKCSGGHNDGPLERRLRAFAYIAGTSRTSANTFSSPRLETRPRTMSSSSLPGLSAGSWTSDKHLSVRTPSETELAMGCAPCSPNVFISCHGTSAVSPSKIGQRPVQQRIEFKTSSNQDYHLTYKAFCLANVRREDHEGGNVRILSGGEFLGELPEELPEDAGMAAKGTFHAWRNRKLGPRFWS